MKRRLFTTVSSLSLLLCVSSLVLWRIDYGNTPMIWRVFGEARFVGRVFGCDLGAGGGGFSLKRYRSLAEPQYISGADGMIDPGLLDRAIGRSWELPGIRYRTSPHWGRGGTQRPQPVIGVMDAYSVDYWLVAASSGVLPAVWGAALACRSLRRQRHVPGTCVKCGYDLRASEGRCPECGTPMVEVTRRQGA